MSPYREVWVLTKTIQLSLFERILHRLSGFQFARRRLGGHWERERYLGKYFDETDRLGEWKQLSECTRDFEQERLDHDDFDAFYEPDELPQHLECEDYP